MPATDYKTAAVLEGSHGNREELAALQMHEKEAIIKASMIVIAEKNSQKPVTFVSNATSKIATVTWPQLSETISKTYSIEGACNDIKKIAKRLVISSNFGFVTTGKAHK